MATTEVWRDDMVVGNQRVVSAKLTTSTSSDTYNTGLSVVRNSTLTGGSAATTAVTFSGGTATITSSAGVTGLWLTAWGF